MFLTSGCVCKVAHACMWLALSMHACVQVPSGSRCCDGVAPASKRASGITPAPSDSAASCPSDMNTLHSTNVKCHDGHNISLAIRSPVQLALHALPLSFRPTSAACAAAARADASSGDVPGDVTGDASSDAFCRAARSCRALSLFSAIRSLTRGLRSVIGPGIHADCKLQRGLK